MSIADTDKEMERLRYAMCAAVADKGELQELVERLRDEVCTVNARLVVAIQALQFYAERENWKSQQATSFAGTWASPPEVDKDVGKIAQAALIAIGAEKGEEAC